MCYKNDIVTGGLLWDLLWVARVVRSHASPSGGEAMVLDPTDVDDSFLHRLHRRFQRHRLPLQQDIHAGECQK